MADIISNEFNGVSDSRWAGIRGSFFKMVGIDIHSNPGSITVNQKLAKDSGSTVTEFCKVAVSLSTGWQIWFSADSGKIWTRQSNGTWALAHTTTPTAGEAKCLGAAEFNGYLYWATQSRLHRIPIANVDGSWAGETEDFATFEVTDSEYHPMIVQNQRLLIGDGNQIAEVQSDATFDGNRLDLLDPLRITTMVIYDIDILIGTIIASTKNEAWLVRWDAVQDTWQAQDVVHEPGINAFIEIDNVVWAQVGISGNWYYYDGNVLIPQKRIPGTWTPSKYGKVHANSVGYLRGTIPVFGFSNTSGNPADQGIYTLGNYSADYPRVLSGVEYVISPDKVASVELGAILTEGNDMYVAWKDGSTYGIDKLDYSNKYASAYIESRVLMASSHELANLVKAFANYRSLPSGTDVTISYDANYTGSYTPMGAAVTDTNLKQIRAEDTVDGRVFQIKWAFTVSNNDAPEVDQLGASIQ